jgi:hypothetical protein
MENQLQSTEIAKRLNNSVQKVITSETLIGFEKAYQIASAAQELQTLLTPQYMKPIMALQGNKLGFKTDKDTSGGYPENIVKNCLIEAVLMGVQPFGNQFNIIANNTYITKEGFGYLLANYSGLSYEISPELPRINGQSAAVVMNLEWTINGTTKTKKIDFAIKVNQYMGADAVIGKATRKARAWLYNTITGSEISDGDITDANVVSSKINDEPIMLEDLQFLFDAKKESLTAEELKNAERILTNKEENSYNKLLKTLQSK